MPQRLRFDDRLLAEAAATWEALDPSAIDDRAANQLAQVADGDFEQRLIVRAKSLPIASALEDALRHVRGALGLMIFAALVLATAGGVAAARALLGPPHDEPVNIFHLLAAMLGPQMLLLIAWICVMTLPRSSGALMSIASLGGIVVRAGQWLARRIHPGRPYAAAVGGISRTLFRGAQGRWTFSTVSHALWLSFNIGCLAMLVFLLSTRQYAFGWETTILSERTYIPLTHAIGALPKAAGFITPTDQQIAETQWKGERKANLDASQAWSALLVGSIVMYGFAPRLLLLALSLGKRRMARRRYRLDGERPEFARLRGVLEPEAASLGVIDAHAQTLPSRPRAAAHAAVARLPGLPAIIGFELPPAAERSDWPPRLHGVRWHDLGMIDNGEDRRRVVNELSRGAQEPSTLLIACSLTTTPDRGVGAFLAEVSGAISRPALLVLTGGQRLRERGVPPLPSGEDTGEGSRGDGLSDRIEDWTNVAVAAGIPRERIVKTDFDHLTHTTQARLAALVTGRDDALPAHERRFEQALQLIVDYVRKWKPADRAAKPPGAADHAALHRDIAKLYGGHSEGEWRRLLHLPRIDASAFLPQNLSATISTGAKRFADLLPERLKRSPKWLAAGATAGALGCVAASALISPIALTALPVWSGIGAVIAGIAQPSPRAKKPSEEEAAAVDFALADAVRSAALFAMLLELQGFDERTITRVLDAAVSEQDAEAFADGDEVQRWLDDLRHRFDLALAKDQRH